MILNGIIYLKIGEAAKQLGRSPQTIRNWYRWYESLTEDEQKKHPLPTPLRYGGKNARYFTLDDINKLREFSQHISYGSLAEFNHTLWGSRGKGVERRCPHASYNANSK